MGTPSPDPGDVLTRAAPPADFVISYGPGADHVAEVRLPAAGGRPAPLIVFLHGGFWRVAYDRTHTGPLAAALAAAGYAVCVPEFRRTGQPGGGWPGTFDDVATAVDRLPAQVRQAGGPAVTGDEPVLLAGHSAGGHLALWAAGRHQLPPDSAWYSQHRARGVVALAPVSDLAACHKQGLGSGAADPLMGGGPDEVPDRYRAADPAVLLPVGCPVRVVHGSADDRVPCAMSREYVHRARAAGDEICLDELPGTGHFEVIDPLSAVWPEVLAAFGALAPPRFGT
jgi:acetyl esterase/lipase